MKKFSPVNIIVHSPKTEEKLFLLRKKAANIHATSIINKLNNLNFSSEQNKEILKIIIQKEEDP